MENPNDYLPDTSDSFAELKREIGPFAAYVMAVLAGVPFMSLAIAGILFATLCALPGVFVGYLCGLPYKWRDAKPEPVDEPETGVSLGYSAQWSPDGELVPDLGPGVHVAPVEMNKLERSRPRALQSLAKAGSLGE